MDGTSLETTHRGVEGGDSQCRDQEPAAVYPRVSGGTQFDCVFGRRASSIGGGGLGETQKRGYFRHLQRRRDFGGISVTPLSRPDRALPPKGLELLVAGGGGRLDQGVDSAVR